MRILVCGSRHFGEENTIEAYNQVKREIIKAVYVLTTQGVHPMPTIIEGDAPGADTLAGQAAKWFGFNLEVYPANWKKYGRAAGPIRNKQMLDEGKPDLVVAFWDGKSPGTKNMIKLAEEAGVPVKVVDID